VWSLRRPGDQKEASQTQALASDPCGSCGGDGISRALDRAAEEEEEEDDDDDQDQPDRLLLRGSSAPFYTLRRARSGVIRSEAALDLFPTCRKVGGGITFPLVSVQRMPGAEGLFSSMFSAEP